MEPLLSQHQSADLSLLEAETASTTSASGALSQRERIEYEYLRKRDPLREFFALVSSSNCRNLCADAEVGADYQSAPGACR